MLSQDEIKKGLGRFAAELVPAGSVVGMGTGSTVFWLIQALADRASRGQHFTIVPTSRKTRLLAEEAGLGIVELNDAGRIPLTIDGADEIDGALRLIKGGGGALLQEKMVAGASEKLVIIADESKYVNQLGKFPLPVEVIPAGWKQVQTKITTLGCQKIILREKENKPFVTDHGHFILDCYFEKIADPAKLDISLQLLPGVVDTGLFIDMADQVIIGRADGTFEKKRRTNR